MHAASKRNYEYLRRPWAPSSRVEDSSLTPWWECRKTKKNTIQCDFGCLLVLDWTSAVYEKHEITCLCVCVCVCHPHSTHRWSNLTAQRGGLMLFRFLHHRFLIHKRNILSFAADCANQAVIKSHSIFYLCLFKKQTGENTISLTVVQ